MTQAQRETEMQTSQATGPSEGAAIMEELLKKDLRSTTTYTPFLATEPIKLNPAIVIKYLCKPTKEGYVCTDEQATRFIMLCKARGLNPWEGDAFLVGYDGKNGPEFNLITAHQAFLKRAEAHPKFEGMESGVTVYHQETEAIRDIEGDYVPEDCVLIGGWARVHRSDRRIPTYRRVDLKSFDKGFSLWGTNKAGMIVKCAEADSLRSTFPNSLAGMYAQGEIAPIDAVPAEDKRLAPLPPHVYQMAKKLGETKDPTTALQTPLPGGAEPHNPPGSDNQANGAGASVLGKGENPPPEQPPAPSENSAPTGGTGAGGAATGRPSRRPGVAKKYCMQCGAMIANGKCPTHGADIGTGVAHVADKGADGITGTPADSVGTSPGTPSQTALPVAPSAPPSAPDSPSTEVDDFAAWRVMTPQQSEAEVNRLRAIKVGETSSEFHELWKVMPLDVRGILNKNMNALKPKPKG